MQMVISSRGQLGPPVKCGCADVDVERVKCGQMLRILFVVVIDRVSVSIRVRVKLSFRIRMNIYILHV